MDAALELLQGGCDKQTGGEFVYWLRPEEAAVPEEAARVHDAISSLGAEEQKTLQRQSRVVVQEE